MKDWVSREKFRTLVNLFISSDTDTRKATVSGGSKMDIWGPKPVVIKDEFTASADGKVISTVLEAKLRAVKTVTQHRLLAHPLELFHQACTALEVGCPEVAVLGFRAAIESAGYAFLTFVPRRGIERRAIPVDLTGRVRRVEFAEILEGLKTRNLPSNLAEAIGIVQFHGNEVAHALSRRDVTTDKVQRQVFGGRPLPKSKDERVFLVPVHTPTAETATEDARTAARVLLLIHRALAAGSRGRRRGHRGIARSGTPRTAPR